MSTFIMDNRVRLSIALALTAKDGDLLIRQQREASARQLGMTGAEIDMASRGASFDALTSFAIALAVASHATDITLIESARERAVKAGISVDVCVAIEAYAIETFDAIA